MAKLNVCDMQGNYRPAISALQDHGTLYLQRRKSADQHG
jgi:hypothetical protein